jgi:uncharacterized protein YbaP (TraB family)
MNRIQMMKFVLGFLCASMFLTSCSAQENTQVKPLATPNIPSTATSLDAPSQGPAIWMLKDDDTTIYLFGTVHILPKNTNWQHDTFKRAFGTSPTLYLEADTGKQAVREMSKILPKLAFYGNGQTLRSVLSPQDEAIVTKLANTLRLPLITLDRMKPWFASLSLSQMHFVKQGYRTDSGVEQYLMRKAKTQHKAIRYLETGEQQLHYLADLPQASQIAFLVSSAKSIEEQPNALDQLVNDWVTGNVAGITELLNDPANMGDATVYAAMLTTRNQKWTQTIHALMEDETGVFFFGVGAAHLAGDDSVIAMLKAQGRKVTRQ